MINLSHDSTLWRVQLALSGLNAAVNSVRVEQSANQLAWVTVRGGTTLPIVSGAGSLDSYEYFASADGSIDTFYRVTTVDPPPGLLLPGTSGAFASTPDGAPLDITGDIDLRCEVTLDDWAPGDDEQALLSKYESAGDQRSYQFQVGQSGELRLLWSTDGTSGNTEIVSSTAPVPVAAGERLAVRVVLNVDNDAGQHVLDFYTAPSIDGPWERLGSQVANAGVTSIFAGASNLRIGAEQPGGTGNLLAGVIHDAEVRDGIGGTVVASPDFTAEPSGTGAFNDAQGNAWTVNGDSEIVSFETADIAVTQEALALKSIRYPLLNRAVKLSDYTDLERPAQLGVHAITGRSFPIATTDVNSSVRVGFEFYTETEDEARRLKLLLALGDILYLQSPAEVNTRRPPRSMYVVADSSVVGRIGTGTHRRQTVPFTEVAAPAPGVTGTTLTWANVFATFGNWNQLISANPTWYDLLQNVGDPEDLVVL